jgi:hypothetical protein
VNLRTKGGALEPVSPRAIVGELSQKYNRVFIHRNNDYENWIGLVTEDGRSSVYWEKSNDESLSALIKDVDGEVNGIHQTGNILSLVTPNNVYYLLYQNGKYTFYEEIPQTPVITFSTSDNYIGNMTLYMSISNIYEGKSMPMENFVEVAKALVYKAMDGYANGWTDKNGIFNEGNGPHLFDACFIRYAIRLYDGSLVRHSPPILVMPRDNILYMKSADIHFHGTAIDTGSSILVTGYKIYMYYNFENLENWEGFIQSVDIFMSAPLGISNIEHIRKDLSIVEKDQPRNPNSEIEMDDFVTNFNLIKEIPPDALNNITQNSTFYFIKSIPVGTKKTYDDLDVIPSTDMDFSKMENLIQQEVMTDDNFSNHIHGAKCSYSYNSRLHIADINTTFFKGFNPGYFTWNYLMKGVATRRDSGDVANSLHNLSYNGVSVNSAPKNYYEKLLTEVEINTGTTNEKVYSLQENFLEGVPKEEYRMYLSAFLSYPDARAKRMTIYRQTDDKWYKVFSEPLQKHKTLNLAYYLSDGLKPIVEKDPNPELVELSDSDIETKVTLREPNKLKVSELNNPIFFPNVNTYQAGPGTILAMATNMMNVSDRNYGQYPLYVFTTRGVWTLNVGGGEVVYSTQTAPAALEAPAQTTSGETIVGETPVGVVFATSRGLFCINGQSVIPLSAHLEQKPTELNIEMNSHCQGVVHPIDNRSFPEILKNLSAFAYNPIENELIINIKDPDYPDYPDYNYVLNLDSRQFYQSTEKWDFAVGNAFPDLFVIEGKTLKDYASAQTTMDKTSMAHVSFILRPISSGITDIKCMERMILRALLYDVTNPGEGKFSLSMEHRSNDGVNFPAVTGYPLKVGNHRDFDMGLHPVKNRLFLYTFAGLVDERSRFFYLDATFRKEYENTKMR